MADIELSVGLTDDEVRNKAKSLQKEIEDIFKKTSNVQVTSDFNKLKTNMDKAYSAAVQLKNQMDKMKTVQTDIPTEAYTKLQKDITDATNKLIEQRKRIHEAEVNNESPKTISALTGWATRYKKDIADYEAKLQKLEASGGKYRMGDETKEYADLKNKLNGVVNQMYQYKDAAYEMDRAGKVAADGAQVLGTQSNKTEVMMKQLGSHISNYVVSGLNNMVHSLDKGITKVAQFSAKTVLAFAKLIPGVRTATKLFNKMKDSFSGMSDSIAKQVPSISKLIKLFLRWGLGIRSVFILWRKLRTYAIDAIKAMAKQIEEVNVDVSNLINTFNQFKMSLGTLVQPLMHALAPAIIYIINLLISAANALANFFAILTGQKYIYKAVKANDKFGDSVGGVGSAAKEANEELAEYDNLLVIDQDTPGGGGGGGGGAADDIAGTFEKVIAESDFAKALRESIEKGDWYGVGVVLGDKLNSLVNVVDDWIVNKFEPMGKEFARRLALILNGAIATIDFFKIGKTLADGINAVFRIADEFLTTFDFKTFGKQIGEGINGLITFIDAKQIGKTFVDAINGAIDFALTLGSTIQWAKLGTKLADGLNEYIRNFHAKELGEAIHTWISGAITAATQFFTKTDFEELGNKIGEFLDGLDIKDLASKLFKLAGKIIGALADVIKGIASTPDGREMLAIGAAIGAVFAGIKTLTFVWDAGLKTVVATAIGELISTSVTSGALNAALGMAIRIGTAGAVFAIKAGLVIAAAIVGWKIGTKIYEAASGHDVDQGFIEELQEIFEGFFGEDKIKFNLLEFLEFTIDDSEGWYAKYADYAEILGDTLYDVFGDALYDLFTEDIPGIFKEFVPAWKEIGENILAGLLSPFADENGDFDTPIRSFFSHLIDAIKYIFGISSPAKNMNEYGEYILEGILDGFTNAFDEITDAVKACWKAIKKAWDESKTKKYFESVAGKIEESFEDINDWFAEKFEDAWNKLSEKWNESDVKKHFDKIVEKIKNAFDTSGGKSVAEAIGEKFSKAWENVKKSWTSDKQGSHFSDIANAIKDKFSGINDIATWFENKFAEVWTKITEAFTFDKVSEFFGGVKDSIVQKFADIKDEIEEKFSDAWKSVTGIWDTEKKVGPHFNTVKNKINSNFNDATDNIKKKFSDAWTEVKKIWNASTINNKETGFGAVRLQLHEQFNNVYDNIKTNFEKAWNKFTGIWNPTTVHDWLDPVRKQMNEQFSTAISYISNTFSYNNGFKIFNDFVSGALKPFNDFADRVKQKIDEAMNKLKQALNDPALKITVPGAKASLNSSQIPQLAQGAVIPPNKEFLAVLGDQKSGANIETPLDTMVEAFKMAMADENSSRNNQPIVLQLNGRTVAEVVWNESEKRYKQSGRFMPSYV